MKPSPRLLPLIAVAIGGVLAMKALDGVQALPTLLAGAQAQAEETPPDHRHPSAKTAKAIPAVAPTLPAAVPHAPAPVCAQSPLEMAKAAGLSPGELQTLQNLGARRGQLDDRARALDTQIQLLAAAEGKIDAKMKAMNALKVEIQTLLGQQDQHQQAEVDRLTNVYQKMKPRDAAAVMATLDDRVRIPVAAKMKDAALAAILSQMPTLEAKKLTESLARKVNDQSLSQAQEAPAAALLNGKSAAPTAAPTAVASADAADDAVTSADLAKAVAKGKAKSAKKQKLAKAKAKPRAKAAPVAAT